ncbi:MAG: RidA family protein [Candidatus Aminicenantes bacterium]|nr:RidA family protein [Candidatus Aminicenantes bacterium]
MSKKLIETKNAPEALGPYSQAVSINGFLFLSGQIGIDPAIGKVVEGGVSEQTKQIFSNIKNVLAEAGSTLDDVVKVTVFLKNMDDFSLVNSIYAEYFTKPYPARSAVQVAKLPLDVDIEIETIATM